MPRVCQIDFFARWIRPPSYYYEFSASICSIVALETGARVTVSGPQNWSRNVSSYHCSHDSQQKTWWCIRFAPTRPSNAFLWTSVRPLAHGCVSFEFVSAAAAFTAPRWLRRVSAQRRRIRSASSSRAPRGFINGQRPQRLECASYLLILNEGE